MSNLHIIKCSWPDCESESKCSTLRKAQRNHVKHIDQHILETTYYIDTYVEAQRAFHVATEAVAA